jgi:hypothetical protein
MFFPAWPADAPAGEGLQGHGPRRHSQDQGWRYEYAHPKTFYEIGT